MNPYQEIIDWLRSPAGERWSERRMRKARGNGTEGSPVDYATIFAGEGPMLIGVFTVKED